MIDMTKETEALKGQPMFTLSFDLGDPVRNGSESDTAVGSRIMFPCIAGTVRGRVDGEVMAGQSANWMIVRQPKNGQQVLELEGRYTIRTHDGATIYVRPTGFAYADDSDTVWSSEQAWDLRVSHMFECHDPRYAFLRGLVAVGWGTQNGRRLTMQMFTLDRIPGQGEG